MRILVAEDDADISTLYKRTLEKRKHVVVLTSTGETCIQNYFDTLHRKVSAQSNSVTTARPNASISSISQNVKSHNKWASNLNTDASSYMMSLSCFLRSGLSTIQSYKNE